MEQETEKLERIIAEFQEQLFRFAFFRVGSAADAQDIVQDVFIRLFGKRHELAGVDNLKSYLFRSILNGCSDHLRKRGRRRFVPLDTVAAGLQAPPETEAVREYARIETLLAAIPVKQAEVIRLKTVSGLKFDEISEILGLPLTTVKSRFKYGIDKIRAKMD